MSVPTWKRKPSSAEFIYQVYQLNIRLGEILANKPQKYKQNYTDHIVKTALEALEHLQIVDSIYLSKYSGEQEYRIRREHLLKARGQIEHLSTAAYILLEIIRKHDYASEGPQKSDRLYAKLYDQEMEIGDRCEQCYKLISGIIKSDMETYKKYIRPQKGGS